MLRPIYEKDDYDNNVKWVKGEVSDNIYMLLYFCSVSRYSWVTQRLENKIDKCLSSHILTPTPSLGVLPSVLPSACFARSVGFRSGDWLGLCTLYHFFVLRKSWVVYAVCWHLLSICTVKHCPVGFTDILFMSTLPPPRFKDEAVCFGSWSAPFFPSFPIYAVQANLSLICPDFTLTLLVSKLLCGIQANNSHEDFDFILASHPRHCIPFKDQLKGRRFVCHLSVAGTIGQTSALSVERRLYHSCNSTATATGQQLKVHFISTSVKHREHIAKGLLEIKWHF